MNYQNTMKYSQNIIYNDTPKPILTVNGKTSHVKELRSVQNVNNKASILE